MNETKKQKVVYWVVTARRGSLDRAKAFSTSDVQAMEISGTDREVARVLAPTDADRAPDGSRSAETASRTDVFASTVGEAKVGRISDSERSRGLDRRGQLRHQGHAREPVFVEALVTEGAIERFDVRVLRRLSRPRISSSTRRIRSRTNARTLADRL
jgi:hypothetical protein